MTTSLLVPSSLVREAESKRAATLKLGYVARAAAVFRADRLVVFDDPDGQRRWDGGFVETVLRYAATPPYLRKEVFGTRDELEWAGVLPPLRVSSWTGSESSDSGSKRDGIVTQVGADGRVRVNCGLQHPISLQVPQEMDLAEGERVTVSIASRRPVRAKLVDESPPGFSVERADIEAYLAGADGRRVATSRAGTPLTVSRLGALADRPDDDLAVAFGAPERGLPAILGVDVDAVAAGDGPPGPFDTWLNTVPDQGSEVVRTEEAMFATLACLSLTE
ncbi:MAG: putative RNA uridine N3 methyltransferase [Halobacteriaceae archaeon]